MYSTIYVPVDNSEHSNRAVQTSIRLGKGFESNLVGSHVYSARMHDYRFRQMEFTLPEEYLEEGEISRQRKIHDSLITMGLQLISDCYLQAMEQVCNYQGLPFEKKMMDGKHTSELLKDIDESEYDLVVLGAHGIGRTRDAQIGSVASKVAREATSDVWVVKHVPKADEQERDTILVGVDGSPESFGSLMTAIDLAQKFDKKIELVAVYDPYLHYSVFKGIVDVLTDDAAKVFRFEEQNQLHEEIIDTGLAEIYQSHLNVGEQIATEAGVEVSKTLLDGKVFQKVLDHARKIEPWVLIIGRVGIHKEEGDGLGSNTDNLLRMAPCDVLLTTRMHTPELDIKAEESIHWTPEAEARLSRAPELVRGLARTTILRLALQEGHSVVTSDLVQDAMDRYMPSNAKDRTERLAQALAFEKAKSGMVAICQQCGTAAMVENPKTCTTCGANEFEQISRETVDKIAAQEGGAVEETAYDGRKIRWTRESRKALKTLTDNYQRRRAKARIEKAARRQKMDTITFELAKRFIEEEAGVTYKQVDASKLDEAQAMAQDVTDEFSDSVTIESAAEIAAEVESNKIIGRDRTGVPVLSKYDWDEDAVVRILRVPKGFMRDRTQSRVEEIAEQRGEARVDLSMVEEGIDMGLEMMKEMITAAADAQKINAAAQTAAMSPEPKPEPVAPPAAAAPEPTFQEMPAHAAPAPGVCPVAHDKIASEAPAEKPVEVKPEAAHAAPAPGVCPVAHDKIAAEETASEKMAPENGNEKRYSLAEEAQKNPNPPGQGPPMQALNEISVMSELEKERRRVEDADA